MSAPEIFTLHGDHVTLGQLLKLTGIIASGGEAKLYLAKARVLVNGRLEQRRGRKLRTGDLVEAPDARLVTITSDVQERNPVHARDQEALDSEDV